MNDPGINPEGYLAVIFLLLIAIIIYVIREFANPAVFPWHTYITIFLGYFFAFAVVLLVPLDLALTVTYRNPQNPYYHNSDFTHSQNIILGFFYALVWPTMLLGSFGLVLEEYYNVDGNFTVLSKLISSLMNFSIAYFAMMIAGAVFFGILISEKFVSSSFSALTLVAVLLTNTVYLVALMVLLGYGLVQLPRQLWSDSVQETHLLRVQQKAASQYRAQQETSLNISLLVSDAMKTKEEIGKYEDPALTEAMAIVLKDCPPEFTSATLGKVAVDRAGKVSISSLANLRSQLIVLQQRYKMAKGRMEETKKIAYYLEDVCNAKIRTDNVRRIKWAFKPEGDESEFKLHTFYFPLAQKVVALICAALSLLCYLGIIGSMTGYKSQVSPFSLAIHDPNSTSAGIVVMALLTLGYTCYVTMWSVFQMRIADVMELLPNRQTYPGSLSFNSRVCARLATPVAFYYLGWVFENGVKSGEWEALELMISGKMNSSAHKNSPSQYQTYINTTSIDSIDATTAFSQFYQIQVVPYIGDAFNTVFPILLFIVSFLVLTNVLNRILVLLKLGQLQFGTAIVSEEELTEGRKQLERSRKAMMRQAQRERLHQHQFRKNSIIGVGVSVLSYLLRLFGLGGTKEATPEPEAASVPTTLEPGVMSGFVQKKNESLKAKLSLSDPWKERWMEIRRPGVLLTFKDKDSSADTLAVPQSKHELRLLVTIKTSQDDKNLDLEFPEDVVKLRFPVKEDAVAWRESLEAWREFAINFSLFHPTDDLVDELEKELESELQSQAQPAGRNKEWKNQQATNNALKYLDSADFSRNEFNVEEGSDSSDTALVRADNRSASGSGSVVNPLVKGAVPPDADASAGGGGMFGWATKKATGSAAAAAAVSTGNDDDARRESVAKPTIMGGRQTPPTLEGWLEKKQQNSHIIAGWQRRYFRLDAQSGHLFYGKSEKEAQPSHSNSSIDVRMIIDVFLNDSDQRQFELEMGDRQYRLRASTQEDARRWYTLLNKWREFILSQV